MALIEPKLETHGNNGVATPTPQPTYAPEREYFPTNTPSATPVSCELSSDDEDILLALEEEKNIQNSNETETQEDIEIQDIEENNVSDEEILSEAELKASAISMLEEILSSAQAGLSAQDNSDGWISEWFDAFKEANGIDLTQNTVESAIKKQEEIINELKETLENGEDFEAKWEELTGVKYDEEKIAKYQQATTQIQFVQMGLNKVNNFCDSLAKDAQYDTQATFNKFIEFYGEEKGQEEFLKAITKGINSNFSSGLGTISKAEFSDDGNIILYDENNNPFEIGTVSDISPDNLTYLYSDKFKDEQINSYLENIENTTGINYQESLVQLGELSNEALGEANAVNNILNEYIQSQEGFVDTVAGAAQIGGLALMGIGAVVSAFNPPVGGVIMKTGQGMAIAGTFGDEALEAFDTATNNQNFEEDKAHYQEILKETVTDMALYASGYAIGNVADDFGQFLLSESGSKFAAMVGEIGVDASLSLMSDLVITGEVDFTGEGISQILGLITAIAGGKYAKIQGDSDVTIKPNANDGEIPKAQYNPETGELNTPKAQSETETPKLDYAVAGDNTGVSLRNPNQLEARIKEFENYTPEQIEQVLKDSNIEPEILDWIKEENFTNEQCAKFLEYSKLMPQEHAFLFGVKSTIETYNNIKFIHDLGVDLNPITIRQITDRYGQNLERLSADQIQQIKELNADDLNAYKYLLTEGYASSIPDMENRFDKLNYLLNGEVKDVNLANDLAQLGSEYGIEIKFDNNASYNGDYDSGTKTISKEYIDSLTKGLEDLRASGAKIPNPLYLTDFMDIEAAGGFSASNPNSVILGIEQNYNPAYVHRTLFHEVGHMNDYNPETGEYTSDKKFEALQYTGLSVTYRNVQNNPAGDTAFETITFPDGNTIDYNDIKYLVSDYASSNIKELTAEISMLITNKAIVNKDGQWTIDTQNAPPGYCKGWNSNDPYAVEKLNLLMKLFNYVTEYKYVS